MANCNSIRQRVTLADLHRHQAGCCFWCRQQVHLPDATRDHLLPRSHGGHDGAGNLVMACRWCNDHFGPAPLKLKIIWLVWTSTVHRESTVKGVEALTPKYGFWSWGNWRSLL